MTEEVVDRKMIHASILAFIRNGELGPLRHGMTQNALREILGPPPRWGTQLTEQRARIWRYGDIEFHFDNWMVSLIFSDHEYLTHGGPTLTIDPWIIHRGLPRDEFVRALVKSGIAFSVTTPAYDPNQRHVRAASGVVFVFNNESQDEPNVSGLVSWSHQR